MPYDNTLAPIGNRLYLKKEIEVPPGPISTRIIRIIVRIIICRIEGTGAVSAYLIIGRIRHIRRIRLIGLHRREMPVAGSQRCGDKHQLYRLGLFHIAGV